MIARHAEGIDVAARIERLAFDLLGTHVERRSQRDADLGQLVVVVFAREPGQAEIGDFDFAGGGEHDIFGLDIAMHHAHLGRFRQRRGHLPHDRERVRDIGRAVAGEPILQILPLHVLLGDVMPALDVPHFVNLHDVRMNQRRGGLGFDLEPLQIGGIVGQFGLRIFIATRRLRLHCSAR